MYIVGEDWKTTERTIVQHILDNCKARDIEKFTEQEVCFYFMQKFKRYS